MSNKPKENGECLTPSVGNATGPKCRFAAAVLPVLLLAATAAAGPDPGPPATAPATQPRVVPFQPGIRINWTQRQVEVEFTVILREGLIELFACSPRMREHEAIVRIEARPTHLYQALGLIGLTPGKPMHMDEQGRIFPATGDPVDVEVRYFAAGQELRQEPIECWMKPTEGHAPIGRLPWVFAGSIPLENRKSIATDVEGTVVAVVDFPTSLIALPELHTSRNEELWLRPNTERIPPLNTKGQMIIRAAPLRLRLGADGRLRMADNILTRAELSRRVSQQIRENPRLRVEIIVERGADPMEERSLLQLLRGLKLSAESIEVFREGRETPP